MRADDDLPASQAIDPLARLLGDSGLRPQQEHGHLRVAGMLAPISGYDVGSRRSVIDVVVQLGREGAQRKIVAIEQLSPDNAAAGLSVRQILDRVAA